MRIMHLSNHRIQYNGMVTAAVDLACAQANLGHEVALCSGPGGFDELLTRNNVELFTLTGDLSGASVFGATFQIAAAVRKFRPDVVHAHMVPVALVAWPIAKAMRIPLVTCVQNSFSKFAVLMRVGDRVITGCRAVADDMVPRGIPAERIRPVLNGTIGSARQSEALKRLEAASLEAASGDRQAEPAIVIKRPAVITACGLHPRKGVPDLIAGFKAAAKVVPEMTLYIFGEGPHEAEYRALAVDDGPSNIVFCGQTPVLRPYFEAADVFVLASLADPAPLVICEAREAGLAVIATDVDGIPELLEHGEAGMLVKPGCPAEIAKALLLLFESPASLARWRAKSQVRVDRLGITRVAEETVSVYRECIGAKAGDAALSAARETPEAR